MSLEMDEETLGRKREGQEDKNALNIRCREKHTTERPR